MIFMLLYGLDFAGSVKWINRSIVDHLNDSSIQQNISRLDVPMKKTFVKILGNQGNHQLLSKVQHIEHCITVIDKKYIRNTLSVKI
jgi:hypothetical protein